MSKESKHDHKATKCLKTWIFSLVMLAPFIAIGIKCYYVINNENAKESYRGSYTFNGWTQITEVEKASYNNITLSLLDPSNYNGPNGYNQFKTTDTSFIGSYQFHIPSNQIINVINNVRVSANLITNLSNVVVDNQKLDANVLTIGPSDFNGGTSSNTHIYVYNLPTNVNADTLRNDNRSCKLVNYDNYIVYDSDVTINGLELSFTKNDSSYRSIVNYINNVTTTEMTITNNQIFNYAEVPNYIYDNTLSSVFYASVQELDKASIFSWTTDTGTYTAINNMCTTLGIVSPPLAVLITYWTLISVIYIIIDIVLETLIYLTHWINDKMI